MMRHHGDDVYMTSQLCCDLKSVAAKFLKKVKFSDSYDTSDILPSPCSSHVRHKKNVADVRRAVPKLLAMITFKYGIDNCSSFLK